MQTWGISKVVVALMTVSAGMVAISIAVMAWNNEVVETDVSITPVPQAHNDAIFAVEHAQKPVAITISRINVSASVEEVGITEKGNMAVPKSYKTVGWYRYGTIPGRLGSAVFAGHVDNAVGLNGVFKRLNELQAGDEIAVTTETNETVYFTVTEIMTYPYEQVPTEIIFNRADKARLNLITCAGSWLQQAKTYDKRLIVFAELKPTL